MEFQIKCFLDSSIDGECYSICIYNDKKELLYQGKTDCNGVLCFRFPHNGIYKIIVKSHCFPCPLCKIVYINSKQCNIIPIIFHNPKTNRTPMIHFTLTDQNYKDLPIEKGEITLWHNT